MGGALMRSGPNGSITILNKEYIRDLEITETFGINVFPLNPGMSSTFPWLSQVADSYEEYRIKNLVFTFKSTSTPFVSDQKTMSFGTIIMATQYNVNNPSFNNKRDMENYIGATSGSPLQGQMHIVRLGDDPLRTLYIRQGTPTERNYDLKFYDCGKFEIATVGMNLGGAADASNPSLTCGEIWVSYEIELLKPRLRTSVSRVDHYTGSYRKTGAWSSGNPMGDRGYDQGMVPTQTEGSLGTWRLGTSVGTGEWVVGGGLPSQMLKFNQGHANRFFKIEFYAQIKGPGANTLSEDNTKPMVLEWSCPNTLGTAVQGVLWNIGDEPVFGAPKFLAIANGGRSLYSTVFLKTNGMTGLGGIGENLKFRFVPTSATIGAARTTLAVDEDICFDLVVTEVNQTDFAKNF